MDSVQSFQRIDFTFMGFSKGYNNTPVKDLVKLKKNKRDRPNVYKMLKLLTTDFSRSGVKEPQTTKALIRKVCKPPAVDLSRYQLAKGYLQTNDKH